MGWLREANDSKDCSLKTQSDFHLDSFASNEAWNKTFALFTLYLPQVILSISSIFFSFFPHYRFSHLLDSFTYTNNVSVNTCTHTFFSCIILNSAYLNSLLFNFNAFNIPWCKHSLTQTHKHMQRENPRVLDMIYKKK